MCGPRHRRLDCVRARRLVVLNIVHPHTVRAFVPRGDQIERGDDQCTQTKRIPALQKSAQLFIRPELGGGWECG